MPLFMKKYQYCKQFHRICVAICILDTCLIRILLTWLLSVQIVLLQIKSSLIVAFGWLVMKMDHNCKQRKYIEDTIGIYIFGTGS